MSGSGIAKCGARVAASDDGTLCSGYSRAAGGCGDEGGAGGFSSSSARSTFAPMRRNTSLRSTGDRSAGCSNTGSGGASTSGNSFVVPVSFVVPPSAGNSFVVPPLDGSEEMSSVALATDAGAVRFASCRSSHCRRSSASACPSASRRFRSASKAARCDSSSANWPSACFRCSSMSRSRRASCCSCHSRCCSSNAFCWDSKLVCSAVKADCCQSR